MKAAVRKTVGQLSNYVKNTEIHFRNIFDLHAIPGHKSTKKYKYTYKNKIEYKYKYKNKYILGIFLTYLPSRGTKALSPWENCILCHNTLALTLGWEYVNNEFQCIYRGWNICYCPKERSSLEFSNISFADETLKMIKIEIQVKERSPWVRCSPYHPCSRWSTGICLRPLKEYFRLANNFWCKLISKKQFLPSSRTLADSLRSKRWPRLPRR